MKRILLVFVLLIGAIFSQANTLKIAFLTDLHVVPGNANDSTLRKIVAEINNANFRYVVITGDITNQGSDAELENVRQILSELKSPYYMISGNHETTWSESGCKTYNRLFGQDRFAFTADSCLFIGVPCGPYMKMGDGFIKYEDVLWAKNTIASQLKPGMRLVSFAHYPLDEGLSNYRMYLDILKENSAVADFCGHGHVIRKYDYAGLPGMMGRSLISLNGKTVGYNIIELSSDSLKLYEKQLGQPEVLHYAMEAKAGKPAATTASHSTGEPSFSHLTLAYRDIASVFNNVGTYRNGIVWANSLGQVNCFDVKRGKMAWTAGLTPSVYAKPTVVGDVVVVGTIDGEVVGLSLKNGKEKWRIAGKGVFVGAPRVEGSMVYVAGSNEFLKLDTKSGRVIWRAELPKSYSQGLPATNRQSVMFGAWDTYLYALNKTTGSLEWKWSNGKNVDLLSPGNVMVAAADSVSFLVAPDRFMTCVSNKTGKTLWRDNSYKVRESMGFSADSTSIYAKTMDGWLIAVEPNAAGFKLKWKVDLGLGYEHNPCPIVEHKGVIYIGSRKGEVVAVDAGTHRVLWTEKVGLSSVNGFEVDGDGNIWTSLIEGSIFRIVR